MISDLFTTLTPGSFVINKNNKNWGLVRFNRQSEISSQLILKMLVKK